MHGRLKVRTTEEQKLLKQKEHKKKITAYQNGMKLVLSTRVADNYDPSAFIIAAQLLSSNPDIYTLWNYRKEVVLIELKQKEIEVDEEIKTEECEKEEKLIEFFENEIKLTEQCLLVNPKSYGSWHHRFWVLNRHPKPNWKKEFDLCTKYLTMDDRNFHCWDYRRLILNEIGLVLTEEVKFSTERLNINFSNYSSWHYRSTLQKLDADSLERELSLVESAIFTDPADSSAWFYLRWVLSNPDVTKEHKENLLVALDQLLDLEPDCKWIYMAKCWLTGSLCLYDQNFSDNRINLYKKLEKLDPMRKGQYLEYQKSHQSA